MSFNKELERLQQAMDADDRRDGIRLRKDLGLLLNKQTETEREAAMSLLRNNEGFNRWDAHLLTRIANKVARTGQITDRQIACLQKKLAKYHRQIGTLRIQAKQGELALQ